MFLKLISDCDALLPYVKSWEALAAAALEPNPFYEHWMLLPACRHFRGNQEVRVLLAFREDPSASSDPVLCGVFPLKRERRYMDLPLPAWTLWKYPHCFLTAPLLRAAHAKETLAAFFDWLGSEEAGCRMFEMRYTPGEGRFHQLLVDEVNKLDTAPLLWECFTRAFYRPGNSADDYLSAAFTTKQRSEIRRRGKLLGELGPVTFTVLEREGDVEKWSRDFLRLEASGWKGREGSALACREADTQFFFEVMRLGMANGRALLPAIEVNGIPVAKNSFFLSGEGAFYFKTGFDEQHAKLAPGLQLEYETIRYLHGKPEIRWMDTCTSSDNELYNRMFADRRTIQTLLVPIGEGFGSFAASTLPLLRSLKRSFRSLVKKAPGAPADPRKASPMAAPPGRVEAVRATSASGC